MFDPLPEGTLLELTAELTDWSEDGIEFKVAESMTLWLVTADGLVPTGDWHHQIHTKGTGLPFAYVRTRDLYGTQEICEWATGPLTALLDRALNEHLDAEKAPWTFRLITRPPDTYCLWVAGNGTDQVLVLRSYDLPEGAVLPTADAVRMLQASRDPKRGPCTPGGG